MSTDFDLVCHYHKEGMYVGSVSTRVRPPTAPLLLAGFLWRHRGCGTHFEIVGDTPDGYTYWPWENKDVLPEEWDEVGVDDHSRRLACRICARKPVTPPHSVCAKCWTDKDWCHDEAGPEKE